MKLHKNISLYKEAIRFTSQKMNLKPEYVEKDYWVTYALFIIFKSDVGKDAIFKGGTSLSKCYNIIDRFSEDIDLVVLRHSGETNNKLKSKLRAISSVLEKDLPEIYLEGITNKLGMNRKTVHTYNKEFKGNYGQVRDILILESTWLGYYEPYTIKSVISFVGKMMIDNDQIIIAKENGLLPFNVTTLDPKRTICEKIMSLVRFSYSEEPIEDLKKKVRHTYDLHQILKQNEFYNFFNSDSFEELLLKVAQDDKISFKNNNAWLVNHPVDALLFSDLDNIWHKLINTYNGVFKDLVYGQFPNDHDILITLRMVKERLKTIQWNIEI